MAPSPLKRPTKRDDTSSLGEASSTSTTNPLGYTIDASASPESLTPAPSPPPFPSIAQDSSPRKQSPSSLLLGRYKLRSSERAAKEVPSVSETLPAASREPKVTSFTEQFDTTTSELDSKTVYSPARGKRVLRKVRDVDSKMVGIDYPHSPWAKLTCNEKDNQKTEEKTAQAEAARQRTMSAEQITNNDSVQHTRTTRSQGRRLERASDGTGTEFKGMKEQSKDWLAIPQALKLHRKHGVGSLSRSPSPQAQKGTDNKSGNDSTMDNEGSGIMTPCGTKNSDDA